MHTEQEGAAKWQIGKAGRSRVWSYGGQQWSGCRLESAKELAAELGIDQRGLYRLAGRIPGGSATSGVG